MNNAKEAKRNRNRMGDAKRLRYFYYHIDQVRRQHSVLPGVARTTRQNILVSLDLVPVLQGIHSKRFDVFRCGE